MTTNPTQVGITAPCLHRAAESINCAMHYYSALGADFEALAIAQLVGPTIDNKTPVMSNNSLNPDIDVPNALMALAKMRETTPEGLHNT